MIYYQLYLIENIINGKTYIGKHKTDSFKTDNYLGSGIYLKKSIIKYGIENFYKTILESFYTEEEVNFYEKRYIKWFKEFNKCEYNISDGGDGGNTRKYMSIEQIKNWKNNCKNKFTFEMRENSIKSRKNNKENKMNIIKYYLSIGFNRKEIIKICNNISVRTIDRYLKEIKGKK